MLQRLNVHDAALGFPRRFNRAHLQQVRVLLQQRVRHFRDGVLRRDRPASVLHA